MRRGLQVWSSMLARGRMCLCLISFLCFSIAFIVMHDRFVVMEDGGGTEVKVEEREDVEAVRAMWR